MKRIIIIASLALVTIGANAQSNRTYRTDMQDQTIRQNEARGTNPDTSTKVNLNSGRNNQETRVTGTQQNTANTTTGGTDTMGQAWRLKQYDTSKNNGKFPGGGSGATTDHGTIDNRR